MKRRLWLLMLFLFAGHVPAASADSACEGRFVNPITDICWSCIFPLSLGSIKVSQGTGTRMSRSQQTREPVRPTPTILPVPWCHTSVPFTPKKVPVCMNMPRTPVSQKHPGK